LKLQAAKRARALREPWGTAGLLVAIVALVTALAGAAYAASGGGLSHKQKKEVEKIAKKFAGKPGKAGPQGPAGPPGAPGANGKGGAPGPEGKEGPAGPTGPEGPEGKEGSPWTAGGTLPGEATEYGVFADAFPAVSGEDSGGDTFTAEVKGAQRIPISFTIPLSAPPSATVVTNEQQLNNEVPAQCDSDDDGVGTFEKPQADPGNLCAFVGSSNNIALGPVFTATREFGAVLFAGTKESGGFVEGSWAVTAE
jgi:Collagen triple helix repeat (20 copies)